MIFKVKEALVRAGINNNTKIAVAFSGGCDSSALIHALNRLKTNFGFELRGVHINHCIRGEEADRDAAFAVNFCASLGIECDVYKRNIPLESEKAGESTELCARRLRYEIFDDYVSRSYIIATAHTASDNTETILFNLTRGSGIKGLCGIPFMREGYIRPILSCKREDTERYCQQNNISYVVDSSNLTDNYTRNFIRHRVVTELKKINPSVDDAFKSMSEQLNDIDEMLERMTHIAVKNCRLSRGVYDRNLILELEKPILTRVIRSIVYDLFEIAADSDLTDRICLIIYNGGKTQICENCFSSVTKNKIVFYSSVNKTSFSYKLETGTFETDCFKLNINSTHIVNKLLMQNAIDCDKIIGEATVRNRLSGDSIKLRGRPTKKVRRLMNESEIPSYIRDSIPVIADDNGVIFIPFIGAAERVLPDNNSKKLIIVTSEGKDND